MLKIQKIREVLTNNIPFLQTNPDKLIIYIDKGHIIAAPAKSASFEYHFSVNVFICDYANHPDTITVPVIIWLMENQPEQFQNPDYRRDALNFEMDYLNNDSYDMLLTLKLTERVLVKTQSDGAIVTEHLPEPQYFYDVDNIDENGWKISLTGQPIIYL